MEALLDQEEALALQQLTGSVQRLGEELSLASGLRPRIRRHPLLAVGLGALAGLLGGPALVRGSRRALGALPTALGLAPRGGHDLSSIALASLRALRPRR
jgi:hypothetical protein